MKIEEEVAELLKQYHLSITTAESCTGGLVAGTLVNVPGISDFFKEGYVTYSNEAKEKLLQVSHETLAKFGAVSSQTAEEMARGVAKAAESNIGIATTGIAGPDGGTEEKPVGLIYIGCSYNGKVSVTRNVFEGDRCQVRNQAVNAALSLVRDTILKNNQ